MPASVSALFDRYPEAVLLCARDRRIRYANPAMLRAAGKSADAALGADAGTWFGEALGVSAPSLGAFVADLERVARGDAESFECELDVVRGGGERLHFVARAGVVDPDEDRAILVQLHDETAHWRTERALESRFHLLQTIIDAIPSPIFFKDRAGVYRGCNKAFEQYIGMPTARVVGATVWDVAPKELADKYHQMDEALMQARGVQVYEHGVRYADGSIHEVVFHKATFASTDGEVGGLVGVMLDITERKRAEEEMRRAAIALEASVATKSRFLAVVSHEIRTPLNGVLGMIDLLERSGLAAEQQRMLAVARSSAEHLLYLLNNVLDFSKLEADKVELEANDFAVHELVTTVTEANAQAAQVKGIEVGHSIAHSVPRFVRGDGARLRQILFNLVSNAIKFTEEGRVTVSVQRDGGSALRFEVRDTGLGIKPEVRDRLFTEFAQGDVSIARRYGGTGLGLAISKRLVERMGGTIDFDSEPGQGATFWFVVPLAPARDVLRPLPLRAERLPAPPHGALRVLVVEDNHVNQLVTVGMLHALGHTARVVANGAEAIDAVRREPFDLVLMDLEMPEMDGLAATRAIRAGPNGARVPILAVTAHALGGVADMCREAGMDGWIAKPLRVDPLGCAIASCFAPVEAPISRARPISAAPRDDGTGSGAYPNGGGLLDAAQLQSLAATMGPAEMAQLLEEFFSALSERMGELARALPDGDPKALFPHAHAIKGMCDQVGARALASVARQWEAALMAGSAAELSLDEMRAVADETRAAIRELVQSAG